MVFNSIQYLVFFPVVVSIYFLIPIKFKNYWLLIASYFFYMCWNIKYSLLIFGCTLITYICGILIQLINNKYPLKAKKYNKIVLFTCVIANLSVLFFFKYFNFFLDTIASLLALVNIRLAIPNFDILLPVGISFYTFQALSYVIDVYRGETYAEKNFFQYALFVSFFPQLVAGPIERSKNLLKQLAKPKKFDYVNARDGFMLIIWGLFLKIVIADRISIFVNNVYGSYDLYPGLYLIIATILFSFQIYCDFYGYSTIAVGSAKMLNIQLTDNFNSPYFANSVSDFWRRWHISLSSWFKDYLYIPLGGNKKGIFRKYLNKIIVFLASGLWHGASLTYAIWGLLNGIYQVIGEITTPLRNKLYDLLKLNKKSFSFRMMQVICTYGLISFSWIFFRANTVRDSFLIIKSIFTNFNLGILFDGSLFTCGLDKNNFSFMIFTLFILMLADYFKTKNFIIREKILKQDYWFRWIVISISIVSIVLFGMYGPKYDVSAFIYFQF